MSGFSKGGPIVCLAYVCLMMFLPMFELDCGMMTFEWNGVQLVTGSEGPLEAFGEQMESSFGGLSEAAGDVTSEAGEVAGDAAPGLPKDWLVLVLPGLALLGIFSVLAGQRAVSAVLIALLIGAFAWFTVRGFELERMFEAQLATDMAEAAEMGGDEMMPDLGGLGGLGDVQIEARKAMPFWLGFGAAGLALLMVAGGGRKR